MLYLSSEIGLSYILHSQPNLMILNLGIFQNTGMNYKASATHKLKPSPVRPESKTQTTSESHLWQYFRTTRLSSSTWSIHALQPITNLPDWCNQSWQEDNKTPLSQSKTHHSIIDMTIHPKDCQTRHVQALPKHHRRTPVIPILDLLTMKAMATTMTATTLTQEKFIL